MPESRVTLQDIADHLGLSRPTVSMALRGIGRVSKETRERVRHAADELGYQPDPLLSAFSRHRQKGASPGSVIALAGAGKTDLEGWLQPVIPTAARLGYRLEPFPWADYPSQRTMVHVLESRGVAGTIFIEHQRQPVLELPLWERLRCVQCGPFPGGIDAECPFPIVRDDPFDAASLAWQKARDAGFRRIAFLLVTKSEEFDTIEKKALGGFAYCQEHSPRAVAKLRPRCILTDETRRESCRDETRRWLATEKPDVVITSTRRGFEHLGECGRKIPDELAVINLRQSALRADIAGLTLDRVAVINTAICHLHFIIQHGPEMQTVHQPTIVLNPIWQDGASFPVSNKDSLRDIRG